MKDVRHYAVGVAAVGCRDHGCGVAASRTHLVRLGAVAVVVWALLCAAGATSGSSASPASGPLIEFWDGTSWAQQLGPNPNGSKRFNAVTAVSPTDVWIAGGRNAFHWDGTAWKTFALPGHGGVNAMTAESATDVWAVASSIRHWNGTSWTVVPKPRRRLSRLFGVSALSPRNAWAVGDYYKPHGHFRTLVLHWNGRSWKRMPSPHPGHGGPGSQLMGVSAVSARSAWAVGSYSGRTPSGACCRSYQLILHWNGKTWRQVKPGGDRNVKALYDVAALGRNNVWAVGISRTFQNSSVPLFEHWNGHFWQTVAAPPDDPAMSSQTLTDLAPLARNDIWAAGWSVDNSGNLTTQALAEHWDGKAWSISPTPSSGAHSLFLGIAAATPRAAWAVGYYSP